MALTANPVANVTRAMPKRVANEDSHLFALLVIMYCLK
jgi:hypothetical protein